MSAFTDLLERHVPYASQRRDNVICLMCLDATAEVGRRCHGEFPTSAAWAAHVEAEMRAAGLKVGRRAHTDKQQDGALF